MSNHNPRKISAVEGANRLSKSAAFKLGYEDYLKARPFNYDIPDLVQSIDYERGRNFAVWNKLNAMPRATWRNGVAAKTVVERLIQAIRSQYVI